MIGRATTPTHTLRIPIDTSLVKTLMVIYAQADNELFHKNKEDCILEENTIKVTLTQEDTLLLDHKKNAQIQVRGLTHDGKAFRSKIKTTSVGKILNEEVLV